MGSLNKKLETRHVNMIALGGSIGTGLFLVSGYSVAVGGPGGSLLAYIFMAIIVYFLMNSLAEMSAFKPSTGSFCDYSTEYVGKSFGVAMGYNYWMSWLTAIALEISAASLIMGFWFPHINPFIFSVVFFIAIVASNLLIVRVYGEIEYALSFIKVSAIIVFLVLAAFSIFKQPQFGTQNWSLPGAPFHNGFYGFISVFLFVGLSFQGTELVGVTSEETKNPETTIPKAIGMVFWRLTLFYVLSILAITLLIPYTDPRLQAQNNLLTSPYTLVFQTYVGKYAADIVNFVILIAVLSAANASLYSSSRILWYLGKSKQAPTSFAYTNKHGTPMLALAVTIFLAAIFLISSIVGSGVFFNYIAEISSLSGFIVWLGIALSHYKFRQDYLPKHHLSTKDLKFKSKFFPFAPLISLFVIGFVILGQVLTVDVGHRTLGSLLITYISVIIFIIIYFVHKLFFANKEI